MWHQCTNESGVGLADITGPRQLFTLAINAYQAWRKEPSELNSCMFAATLQSIGNLLEESEKVDAEARSRPEWLDLIMLLAIKEPFTSSPGRAPTPALTSFFETAIAGGLSVSARAVTMPVPTVIQAAGDKPPASQLQSVAEDAIAIASAAGSARPALAVDESAGINSQPYPATAQGQMDALMSKIFSNPNATLQSLEDDGLVRFTFPSATARTGPAPNVNDAPSSRPSSAAAQPQAPASEPIPMMFESLAELQTLTDARIIGARPPSAAASAGPAPAVSDASGSQPLSTATKPQATATEPMPMMSESPAQLQSLIDAGVMSARPPSAAASAGPAPAVSDAPGSQPLLAATQPQAAATAPSSARASWPHVHAIAAASQKAASLPQRGADAPPAEQQSLVDQEATAAQHQDVEGPHLSSSPFSGLVCLLCPGISVSDLRFWASMHCISRVP